jgi:hypothetical protein
MAFVIPPNKTTPAERLGYCAAAMEKLRRHHNEQSAVLKPDDMRRWIKGSFQPYSLGICRELLKCRAEVEADQTLAGQAKALQVTSGKLVYPPGLDRWQDRYALLWAASRGAKLDQEPTERDSRIGEALGAHKFAPPQSALDEIVLPALDARGEVVDPYEDYTTYTEVDPSSDLTVAANTITVSTLRRDAATYVYADKGAAHFGNFTHLLEVNASAIETSSCCSVWSVANLVGTWLDEQNANVGINLVFAHLSGTLNFRIYDNADDSYDIWTGPSLATWYYITVDRNGTALTAYIRTESHTGTLQDTIATAMSAATTFRYVYGVQSWENGTFGTAAWSGSIANLDLQEAAAGLSIPVAMRHYLQMMGAG